jgi:sugar transferase (PEP-CTERM/EpsH1 system associated)
MNILFVCHRLPFPPNRGGKIRPFHMIQHLGQQHSVVVASLAESEQEIRAGSGLKQYCSELIVEMVPRWVRWVRAFGALLFNRPSSVAYFGSPKLRRRIQAIAQSVNFDVIIVHCAFVAQYVTDIPARLRILDFGDLDSGKWFDYSRCRAFPLSLGYGLEARKLRSFERELAVLFDQCTVTTFGELEEYKKLDVVVPSTVIPNGVDLGSVETNRNLGRSNVIAFVGRMDYFPNIDAMLYFAREIFPVIRKTLPSVELRIIGSNPVPAVRGLASIPGVTVTGHVPDVRPYLGDATVSVAPLRIARGTQNKILESMALGIPVVATPMAAKGVQAAPGRHLLVAENSEDFARKVTGLLRNAELRRDLSESARRQIEKAHSWRSSMNILDDILARVTNDHPSIELDGSYDDKPLMPDSA